MRTVDTELEQNIGALREMQLRYEHLLTMTRSLLAHFHQVQMAQQTLGDCLVAFAKFEPDLRVSLFFNNLFFYLI